MPPSSVHGAGDGKVTALSADLINTAYFFSFFTAIGLVCIWIRSGWSASVATPLLWALTCLVGGAAVGFLFGIPKILQADTPERAGDAEPRATSSSGTAPAVYRQRVNTNLEEISDWLTKIIVGLSLINLAKIPPFLNRVARILAAEISPPGQMQQRAFALAIIGYFTIVGLLFGYLFTRLFLQRAFARADTEVMDTASRLRNIVNQAAQRAIEVNPQAGRGPSTEMIEAAQEVGQLALRTDLAVIRRQIADLAQEYESSRANMASGPERTRRMELIITKMRTLAFAGYPLLPELTSSASPGQRLAAIATLQVKPDPTYLRWLAERIGVEQPFIAYHAAIALLYAARALNPSYYPELQHLTSAAKERLIKILGSEKAAEADTFVTLEAAEKELPAPQEAQRETDGRQTE